MRISRSQGWPESRSENDKEHLDKLSRATILFLAPVRAHHVSRSAPESNALYVIQFCTRVSSYIFSKHDLGSRPRKTSANTSRTPV